MQGMSVPFVDKWITELFGHGKDMAIAWEHYESALAGLGVPPESGYKTADRCLLAAQQILSIGALVSKTLWMSQQRTCDRCDHCKSAGPPVEEQRARARCKEVRKQLGIKGIRVLESRRVRNSLEHFDTRLDMFFNDFPHRIWTDRAVLEVGAVSRDGATGELIGRLRHLDPDTHVYTSLTDSVSLLEVRDAVTDVANRAERWLVGHNHPVKV